MGLMGAAAFSPCSRSKRLTEAPALSLLVTPIVATATTSVLLITVLSESLFKPLFCCQKWKTFLIFTFFFFFITLPNFNPNLTEHLNASYSPKLLPHILCVLVKALITFPCVNIMTISPLESKLLEGRDPVSFIVASHNALSIVTSNPKYLV